VDTNVTAVLRTIQLALPLLADPSSVVCVGSRSVEIGVAHRAHYTATKGAIVAMSRSLAREFGGRRIRFNTLMLGIVDTGAFDELPAGQAAARRERHAGNTALRRLGTPDDIVGAILWLASDLSSYVTGATIAVDGGML
jgi:3-oxoacyl-[acyl-carrier protein] reductase